ncbi:MAG: hypothetical protein ACRD0C_15610 [Acidimicrobiia bacterium]
MSERIPRIRRQPIPADAVFVVRGDEDIEREAEAARFFLRRFSAWGRFGISAYHANGHTEIALLCQRELVRFPFIVVFTRTDLESAGIEVVPTFHRPHVTLAAVDLAILLQTLMRPADRRPNPYHQGERS